MIHILVILENLERLEILVKLVKLEIIKKNRGKITPPAEPATGPLRGGVASPSAGFACRSTLRRRIGRLVAPCPVEDSSVQGRRKTSSRGRDDEPHLCVRHIAGSRRGHQLSRDAHASTTAPPLANSWPTARTVQDVAKNGSYFGLQKYFFFLNQPIFFFNRSHL